VGGRGGAGGEGWEEGLGRGGPPPPPPQSLAGITLGAFVLLSLYAVMFVGTSLSSVVTGCGRPRQSAGGLPH
jgi:hypothetical protein